MPFLRSFSFLFAIAALGIVPPAFSPLNPQDAGSPGQAQAHLHLVWPKSQKHTAVPAVAWLEPMPGTPVLPFEPRDRYTLLQKNRAFSPHLLVVPVGGAVQFPNQDPFFHNVFSLFDGKRFDLGLYEAGSSKSVNFSREGVAYIFCNIHPEMSAVVITLSTPLYAMADRENWFTFAHVPIGSYRLHIWVEGTPASTLDSMTRVVPVAAGMQEFAPLQLPFSDPAAKTRLNEFGKPYTPDSSKPY